MEQDIIFEGQENQTIIQNQKHLVKCQLKYLLVLDFQATCIKDKKLEPCSEIIQFPVIVVDTQTLQKKDVFHMYVKPHYHPILTEFCTQLTGITQNMVQNCKPIQQVLVEFDKWIKTLQYLKEDNFTFLTCGDWDLNICLRSQARAKKINVQSYLKSYINIKKYFVKVLDWKDKSRGMMEMLEVLNVKHQGKHHSGIDDVRNICQICIQLIRSHGATFPKKQIVLVAKY